MSIHPNGTTTEHLIPLLDPLFHTLSGVEDRPGNRRAMWYSRLFCSWPLKLEKGAKRWSVDDTEWLKQAELVVTRPRMVW